MRRNSCGCNSCSGCNRSRSRNRMMDVTEVFATPRRDEVYTWSGRVYYDVEVAFSGPYWEADPRPEPRDGCGSDCEDCGCNF